MQQYHKHTPYLPGFPPDGYKSAIYYPERRLRRVSLPLGSETIRLFSFRLHQAGLPGSYDRYKQLILNLDSIQKNGYKYRYLLSVEQVHHQWHPEDKALFRPCHPKYKQYIFRQATIGLHGHVVRANG